MNKHSDTTQNTGEFKFQLPTPYPDPDAWESNLKEALETDPRRKANYLRYQNATKTLDVDYLPIKLDIENVSRCNYRCTMCQVSDWGPSYQRAEDMSLEDFKSVIDQQYGLLEIKLQGMGEPLLGRDTFFEMVRYARARNIWVRSTNNGSLLHYQDNYKKLIDSGINEVQISIDGATKSTFENIRRGSRFELVVANCKLLNGYCDELGVLRTRMWSVLQKENVAELLPMVDLGHEMGFKRITFDRNLTMWGQQQWLEINNQVAVEKDISFELAQEAIERGRSLGVEVTFWNSNRKYSTESPDSLCKWPFERAFVASDMRIVPCCVIGTPEVSDFGDAHHLDEAWHGDVFREFRRAHLKGEIPQACLLCYEGNRPE